MRRWLAAHLSALTLVVAACGGQTTPPGELPSPASCGPQNQLAKSAFAGDAVWVLVAPDASSVLALLITVRKTDPSYPGELWFDPQGNTVMSSGTDANGNKVFTMRPFVPGLSESNDGLQFLGVCDGTYRGSGGLSVAWTEAPVAGRKEVVTFW